MVKRISATSSTHCSLILASPFTDTPLRHTVGDRPSIPMAGSRICEATNYNNTVRRGITAWERVSLRARGTACASAPASSTATGAPGAGARRICSHE
jgi:hypothetical protein